VGTVYISFRSNLIGSLLRVSPINPSVRVFDGEDKLVPIPVAPINPNLMIIDGEDKVTVIPLQAFNT